MEYTHEVLRRDSDRAAYLYNINTKAVYRLDGTLVNIGWECHSFNKAYYLREIVFSLENE